MIEITLFKIRNYNLRTPSNRKKLIDYKIKKLKLEGYEELVKKRKSRNLIFNYQDNT